MYSKPHYLENLLRLLEKHELQSLCLSRGLEASENAKECIETLLNEPSDVHAREYLQQLPEETIHRICVVLKRDTAEGKTGRELINYVIRSFAGLHWSYYAPLPDEDEKDEEDLQNVSFDTILSAAFGATKDEKGEEDEENVTLEEALNLAFGAKEEEEEEEEEEFQTLDLERSQEDVAELLKETEQLKTGDFDIYSSEESSDGTELESHSPEMQEIENVEELWSIEPFMATLHEWLKQTKGLGKFTTCVRRQRGSIFIQFKRGDKTRGVLFAHFNDHAPVYGKAILRKLKRQNYRNQPIHFHIFYARQFDHSVGEILLKKKNWQKNVALFEVTNPEDKRRICTQKHNTRKLLRPLKLFLSDFLPRFHYKLKHDDFPLAPTVRAEHLPSLSSTTPVRAEHLPPQPTTPVRAEHLPSQPTAPVRAEHLPSQPTTPVRAEHLPPQPEKVKDDTSFSMDDIDGIFDNIISQEMTAAELIDSSSKTLSDPQNDNYDQKSKEPVLTSPKHPLQRSIQTYPTQARPTPAKGGFSLLGSSVPSAGLGSSITSQNVGSRPPSPGPREEIILHNPARNHTLAQPQSRPQAPPQVRSKPEANPTWKKFLKILIASGFFTMLLGGVGRFVVYPKFFPCAEGLRDCGKGTDGKQACAQIESSNEHCGQCGLSCEEKLKGSRCGQGVCKCPGNLEACKGRCVDLKSSAVACGSCGKTCPTGGLCIAGKCSCAEGQVVCGTACISLAKDSKNCGSCGKTCKLGCVQGRCKEDMQQKVKVFTNAKVMRIIPSKFWMGTATSEKEVKAKNERPQTQVTLTHSFWMWQSEVTQKQFKKIKDYNPSKAKTCGKNCPVENVTLHEAMHFCNLLSSRLKLSSCYSCRVRRGQVKWCRLKRKYRRKFRRKEYQSCPGWRLPTEAEWEYAARGKSTGLRYGELDDIAWYGENSSNAPQKVMDKKANSHGLFDMLGNVREWVFAKPKKYLGGFEKNPFSEPQRKGKAIVRGGSWKTKAQQVRAACREQFQSNHNEGGEIGFRPVRTIFAKKTKKTKKKKK